MALLARLAEMLVRVCLGAEAPARDRELEMAIQQGDLAKAYTCLDVLAGPVSQDAPVIALEIAMRGFSLSGRKSAMAMAMRMARELGGRPEAQEAEWETAERLGYSDGVVRQARRILQDFGSYAAGKAAKAQRWRLPSPLPVSSACLHPASQQVPRRSWTIEKRFFSSSAARRSSPPVA